MSQLASDCGVHRDTVAAWVSRGCPYVTRANKPQGVNWEFNTADVGQWRVEQATKDARLDTDGVSESEARRRKLAAEATMAEMEMRKRKSELGSLAEFERQVTAVAIEIRQRMLQIPKRVEPNDTERRAFLETEILEALTALSDDLGSG